MTPGRSGCIFCGSTGTKAKEHVWPAWLQRFLDIEHVEVLATHWSASGPILSQRRPTTGAMQYSGVCKRCNGGWMGALESEVSIVLKEVLGFTRGESPLLQPVEADLLATWAYKTALMLNAQANYRRIVPEAHYRLFFEMKQMPVGACVDIGKTLVAKPPGVIGLDALQSQDRSVCNRPEDEDRFEKSDYGLEYRILLWVGWIVLRVIYVPWTDYKLLLDFQEPARLQRLHPREQGRPVVLDREAVQLTLAGANQFGASPELAALCHQIPMVPREGPDNISHYLKQTTSIRTGRFDGPRS